MVGLGSAEVIHTLRLRRASFRALCPDPDDDFASWLQGEPPRRGKSSAFVLLDPLATGRRTKVIGLEQALVGARPRYRGYAEVAKRLERAR